MAEYIDKSEVLELKRDYGEGQYSMMLIDPALVKKLPTADVVERKKVKQAREEITKQFVDLQDGSEEWRSYVNEAVLECVEILDKLIAESEG